MIAYVFWHTPRVGVDLVRFDDGLRAFHQGLSGNPPAGFVSSRSYRSGTLSWMGDEMCYEDWYLVEDFAALGELNDHAAAGGHAKAHDRVAEKSERGTGSVYALHAGSMSPALPIMYWLDRPDSLSTVAFLSEMTPVVNDAGALLWRRQLSLGPAREYCIQSAERLALPYPAYEITPTYVIWPV